MKHSPILGLSLTILCIIACGPKNNCYVLKEYIGKTKETSASFICKWETYNSDSNKNEGKRDTIEIQQNYQEQGNGFTYSIHREEEVFSIACNLMTFQVTTDSGRHFSIVERRNFTQLTSNLFTLTDFSTAYGMYREYHNTENVNTPSLELTWTYPYRVYAEIKDSALVLHKDYSFKTGWYESYYFSKKLGLYKIETEAEGGFLFRTYEKL